MNEILNAAADLIERDGWCQGAFRRNGKHCLLGAIAETVAGDARSGFNHILAHNDDAREAVRVFLATVQCDLGVPHWNDKPGRTQTEVVAALRKAAQS